MNTTQQLRIVRLECNDLETRIRRSSTHPVDIDLDDRGQPRKPLDNYDADRLVEALRRMGITARSALVTSELTRSWVEIQYARDPWCENCRHDDIALRSRDGSMSTAWICQRCGCHQDSEPVEPPPGWEIGPPPSP